MNLAAFIEELAATPAGPCMFNPYRDTDANDAPDATTVRRKNLANYAAAFSRPEALLVGEAPGPWGCHFSGIAFTSEYQLHNGLLPFKGHRSSALPNLARETSATIVWGITQPAWPNVMQWNACPWHPFNDGAPLSIRTPKASELQATQPLLQGFLDRVKPQRVVAVGRKAEATLGAMGVLADVVRHPARGGATQFRAGLQRILAERAVLA